MPNTSSNLSDKEEHLPEVEVLLATFNGQLYLPEFLKSLCNQQGVKIHLRVSDDGSKDETIKILYKYAESFESFTIHDGPRRGPAANFFFLLRNSQQIFIALADQDDIWELNHLINAITDLSNFNHKAALRFNATVEFGNGIKKNIWPSIESVPRIQNLILENQARGCTIVLNRQAVNLVNKYQPRNAVMHDWWIVLVALLTGRVVYGDKSEVNYRVHGDNAIGIKRRSVLKSIKVFCASGYSPLIQLIALSELTQKDGGGKFSKELQQIVEIFNLRYFQRLVQISRCKYRFRSRVSDEVKLTTK
jgi:glycosyltransferase involved in cell wall biosynthesis